MNRLIVCRNCRRTQPLDWHYCKALKVWMRAYDGRKAKVIDLAEYRSKRAVRKAS